MRGHLPRVALAALSALAGCSDDDPPPLPGPEDCQTTTGICNTIFCDPGEASGNHVETCSAISYHSNPPSSGDHYPEWANFQIYPEPVPEGYWIHSIEHSAIALLYNCDRDGDPACAEMVADLEAYIAARPADDECDAPINARYLLMPYPELGSPFAAVAWGHFLTAECFDEPLVSAFADSFYGQNYENICAPGLDPLDGLPEGCGE